MTAIVAAQGLLYASFCLLWGAALWTFLLDPDERAALAPLRSSAARLAASSLLPAVAFRAWNHAWLILGEYEGPLAPALSAYLRETPQGQAARVMAIPALLAPLSILALASRAPARSLAVLIALLLLPIAGAQAAQGHAQILVDVPLGAAVDAAHMLAAATWVGGLLHLGSWLVSGRGPRREALLRFSRVAALSVILLAASGFATYDLHFGLRPTPLRTGWGYAGWTKLAILAAMLVLAARHRRALRQTDGRPHPREIAAEAAFGVAALAIASLMTQLDPHIGEE